jgi:glutathione synthase/RimK-type ligase-like ATP-grasp enzyme
MAQTFLLLHNLRSKHSQKLLAELTKSSRKNVQYLDTIYSDLEFLYESGLLSIRDCANGRNLEDYDLIYLKTWKTFYNESFAAANYLTQKKRKFIDGELQNPPSFSKLNELVIGGSGEIRFPDSYFSNNDNILKNFYEQESRFGWPLVIKAIDNRKGRDNYLVKDKYELKKVVDENPNLKFMVQQYIDFHDSWRIFVLGFQVKLVIKKVRTDMSTHSNQVSKGAIATQENLEEVDPRLISISETATKNLKRAVAGVDIIADKNGGYYLLEVNHDPEISTGTFPNEKTVKFADYINSFLE